MHSSFERLPGAFLAVAVGLAIGLILGVIRIWRNARNMPTDEKRQELLRMIREWKKLGYSYSKRLALLKEQGYRKDVADSLLGEAERAHKPQ